MCSSPRVVLVAVLAATCHPGESDLVSKDNEPSTFEETGSAPLDDTHTALITSLGEHLSDKVPTLVYASWTQSDIASVRVEYQISGEPWRSSPSRERGAGSQEEILLGIPFGTEVTWRVVAEYGSETVTSTDRAITTGAKPPTLPEATVTLSDSARWDPEMPYVFLSITALGSPDNAPWWAVIVDRQGRAVWAMRSPSERVTRHVRLAADGRALLLDLNSYWTTFDASDSEVVKMTIDGTVLHTYATPGLHHPFVELPDQSIAWGAFAGLYKEELRIVTLQGVGSTLWACDSWLAGLGLGDDCASNTLTYDTESETFLFSLFSVETIVEIDANTGDSLRWFGHAPGSYAFDPPQSLFYWQHGGVITETGTLLTSSDLDANGTETIVREYEIDEATQTLHEVWNFGIGDGIYGRVRGEAHRLGNGDTLHNTGEAPRLREATASGEVVWDIVWEEGEIGRSAPVADLYALAPED